MGLGWLVWCAATAIAQQVDALEGSDVVVSDTGLGDDAGASGELL